MNISFNTNFSPTADTIIPLLQTDALPDQLTKLAESLHISVDALQRDFKAERNEVLPVYGPDQQKTFLVGLGRNPLAIDWLRVFRKLVFDQKSRLSASVQIDSRGLAQEESPAIVEAMATGVLSGAYNLGLYKSNQPELPALLTDAGQVTLLLDDDQQELAEIALHRAEILADATRQMLDFMNAPANQKTPEKLGEWATESGQKNGYTVTVLHKSELETQGLGALLSVSNGSDVPPVLIIMDYQPAGVDNPPVVGLVGKGVTFDTGGVSIKQSNNMHLMKSDMGGAAAVLGTVDAAARLELPVRVIGVVPATENSTDGRSTKPGDVITSYNGKTIEIIDTDAEGRVILADGLSYLLTHYQPNILIDLATLTGSVVSTLGYHAAGMFTNNDALASQLSTAGDRTGERLWRLPLWDAYKDDIKSDVADVKNFHGKPINGAIAAAKFLEFFTDEHPAWVHLDIAGTAFGDTEFGTQKNATGFGIRLLIDYLSQLKKNTDNAEIAN